MYSFASKKVMSAYTPSRKQRCICRSTSVCQYSPFLEGLSASVKEGPRFPS